MRAPSLNYDVDRWMQGGLRAGIQHMNTILQLVRLKAAFPHVMQVTAALPYTVKSGAWRMQSRYHRYYGVVVLHPTNL